MTLELRVRVFICCSLPEDSLQAETANMLIMTSAYTRATQNVGLANQHVSSITHLQPDIALTIWSHSTFY